MLAKHYHNLATLFDELLFYCKYSKFAFANNVRTPFELERNNRMSATGSKSSTGTSQMSDIACIIFFCHFLLNTCVVKHS